MQEKSEKNIYEKQRNTTRKETHGCISNKNNSDVKKSENNLQYYMS
jgi:hypothetical protein